MKFSERMKRILFNKLRPWNGYKECVGYITPIKIKYLLSIGCAAERGQSAYYADQAEKQIAVGEGRGSWFYFVPTKELLAMIRERFPTYARHE